MELNNINVNIHKKKKRLGRGIGSGKGKTSGRGVKGQKSRSGVAIKSYEGGQMPLYRRLPKRGFSSLYKKEKNVVINLRDLEKLILKNKFKNNEKINLRKILLKEKVSKKIKVKILGTGELKTKISISTDKISESARKKIEKSGGSIELIK
ncbi:MAG: 50S ribosomal protein L15 [Candidatus Pelagibacter sp.]|nr:50S ribosomal protein L15 [Candidatus Pelagibacter sp.]OUV98419.1 MAG: 50S ribosomal protein L15 [Candidatus Pelagibacter sp. TMED142]